MRCFGKSDTTADEKYISTDGFLIPNSQSCLYNQLSARFQIGSEPSLTLQCSWSSFTGPYVKIDEFDIQTYGKYMIHNLLHLAWSHMQRFSHKLLAKICVYIYIYFISQNAEWTLLMSFRISVLCFYFDRFCIIANRVLLRISSEILKWNYL